MRFQELYFSFKRNGICARFEAGRGAAAALHGCGRLIMFLDVVFLVFYSFWCFCWYSFRMSFAFDNDFSDSHVSSISSYPFQCIRYCVPRPLFLCPRISASSFTPIRWHHLWCSSAPHHLHSKIHLWDVPGYISLKIWLVNKTDII